MPAFHRGRQVAAELDELLEGWAGGVADVVAAGGGASLEGLVQQDTGDQDEAKAGVKIAFRVCPSAHDIP
ncbi:MAG: hypothetical protein O3A51_04090 [Verrucomicrobia bacterium]|nr:hypothetical protein [Verrucomicrobiota bacterium]